MPGKTFSERFDIVYQAWEQTGRTPLLCDRDFEQKFPTFMQDLEKTFKGESSSPVIQEVQRLQVENEGKLKASPLIKNNVIKLFKDNNMTLEGNIYYYLSHSQDRDCRQIFSISKEVADLVNTAKIDVDIYDNADYYHPGIYDCPEGFLYKDVKAIILYSPNFKEIPVGFQKTSLSKDSENPEEGNITYSEMYGKGNGIGCYSYYHKGRDTTEEEAKESLQWIFKLIKIIQSENSPLETPSSISFDNVRKTERVTSTDVRHYTINLSKRYKAKLREYQETQNSKWKDGKFLAPVEVSGYLKNQHYGKGNLQVKQIWIDGFVRDQWMTDAGKHINVIV